MKNVFCLLSLTRSPTVPPLLTVLIFEEKIPSEIIIIEFTIEPRKWFYHKMLYIPVFQMQIFIAKAKACPFCNNNSLSLASSSECLYFSAFNWFTDNHLQFHAKQWWSWIERAEKFHSELILHLKLSHKVLLNGKCVCVCVRFKVCAKNCRFTFIPLDVCFTSCIFNGISMNVQRWY